MTDRETSDNTHSSLAPKQDKGTFVPLIFGGAVACAIGFFGGQLDWVEQQLGLNKPAPDYALSADLLAQKEALQAQREEIETMTARLEELAAVEPPEVDLSPVNEAIEAQGGMLEDFGARLLTVEKRPMTDSVSRDAIAAYEKELAGLQEKIRAEELRAAAAYKEQLGALQGEVEAQQAEVDRILNAAKQSEADAEEAERRAKGRSALAKIVTAVDDGSPFADALADLEASGSVQVPEALKASAQDGVPTLARLLDTYPAAARTALQTARSTAEDANTLGGFLKRKLGGRSITPQEGDSPDAVLSRAEAAVRQGKIAAALSEIEALPEDGRSAMADWAALAEQRHAAQSAAAEIAQKLNEN